jgi:RNA recognition motif-containing protein
MKPGTDEAMLQKMFDKFGDIASITHKGTYAFIEFQENDSASTAIKEMNEKQGMKVQKAYTNYKPQNGF